MGCLVRFVAGLILMLLLLLAVRRVTERAGAIPPPSIGERDTVVDGIRWRSRERTGESGNTIIYVHGFLSSSATWRQVLTLAAPGHPAIAPDLPGSGFSDRPWPYDYTVPAQALALWRYLDARGVGRVVLVGNSLGGAVALFAAAQKPERVAALVLVDSAYPQVDIPLGFRALRTPIAGEIEMGLLCRPVMREVLKRRIYARPERVTEAVVSDWWDPVPVPGTRRAALAAIRTSREGYANLEKRITMPTLILWGKEDRLLPASEGLSLSQAIPGARLVVLPDAGHVPEEERPRDFAAAVGEFVEGVEAAPLRRRPARRRAGAIRRVPLHLIGCRRQGHAEGETEDDGAVLQIGRDGPAVADLIRDLVTELFLASRRSPARDAPEPGPRGPCVQ